MTILETERLGRKISELLQHVGNADIAPKLAADYATACHAANLRLQQCEAMVKAGDCPQAIQLAETAPNLLDLVTALEFRGSDEWRGYCQQNSLPVADRIDSRSVQILNQCYAQGIATDHPLYATYRSAVLSRNDEEALKTLQSIVRLNPADTNAASELSRLDAKVLTARLQHLGSSLEGAEPKLLVAEIETIEAVGFKNKPDGEIWRKAQLVRWRKRPNSKMLPAGLMPSPSWISSTGCRPSSNYSCPPPRWQNSPILNLGRAANRKRIKKSVSFNPCSENWIIKFIRARKRTPRQGM